MSTTIRVSDETKSQLDSVGMKGESYEDIILKNINFTKRFANEPEFRLWFEENYELLGFNTIVKSNRIGTPDFIMSKDGKNVSVELETLASNFKRHRHDPSKVDVVICLMKDMELPIQVIEVSPFEFVRDNEIAEACIRVPTSLLRRLHILCAKEELKTGIRPKLWEMTEKLITEAEQRNAKEEQTQ